MKELLGKVHFGDAFALISDMPASFVDCTVTSVPYWQQREYLEPGHPLKLFEMGSETMIDKYLQDMADLFAQVHRITTRTGVLWLNVGDKYAGPRTKSLCPDYHDGELLGIPWRLSEALRKVGWRRISEIIWHKPNPIPDGARNRVSVSHEHLFMFARGSGHYFDKFAIREESHGPGRIGKGKSRLRFQRENTVSRTLSGMAVGKHRGARSVWEIPVAGVNGRSLLCNFKEDGRYLYRDPDCPAHGDNPTVPAGPLFGDGAWVCTCREVEEDFFAAMPERLAERCILAATSEAGNCPSCGDPYRRLTENVRTPTRPGTGASLDEAGKAHRDPLRHVTDSTTSGWQAICGHAMAHPTKPVVFDPFVGSGTTLVVAAALGRDWLGCELSPTNAKKIAPARIAKGWQRSALLT